MITEVIFDIETQRLFQDVVGNDAAGLGVSIVSAYVRQVSEDQQEISGRMYSFWEKDLPAMWPHFLTAKRIIGFNSVKFDVAVLRPYAPEKFHLLPHFDIMQSVRDQLGHALSLNCLAEASLGAHKTDVGINAVNYWREGTPEALAKLQHYCEADVLLTRDLYDYGVKNKHIKYTDRTGAVLQFPVDFSYPKEVIDSSRQIGLF